MKKSKSKTILSVIYSLAMLGTSIVLTDISNQCMMKGSMNLIGLVRTKYPKFAKEDE